MKHVVYDINYFWYQNLKVSRKVLDEQSISIPWDGISRHLPPIKGLCVASSLAHNLLCYSADSLGNMKNALPPAQWCYFLPFRNGS